MNMNNLTQKQMILFLHTFGIDLFKSVMSLILRIENDVLYILAERIDNFLNYGDYRKIWSIINNFNDNDVMFDDNNMILAETILDELNIF